MYIDQGQNNLEPDLSILDSLRVLCRVPGVHELRCLGFKPRFGRPQIVSGYYDDLEAMARDADAYDGAGCKGIYLTLNPVNPDLLARAENRAREGVGDDDLTKDRHVLRRIWLPVDADPVRVTGVSSTDAEHGAALERCRRVREWLWQEFQFPAPVFADSGNGGHLDYAIDLPNDDDARDLVHACLKALKAKFSDDLVKVDESNHNSARIWKVYGTLACKGDDTKVRPHRRSRILEVPERLQVVPPEKLAALAALASREDTASGLKKKPNPLAKSSSEQKKKAVFDMPAFLERHGLKVRREKKLDDGRLWELEKCVFDESHAGGEASVMVRDGRPCYRCFHDSCSAYGWNEFRAKLETDPAWLGDPAPGSRAAAIRDRVGEDRGDGPEKGRNERKGSVAGTLLAAALENGEAFTSPEQAAYVRRRDDPRGDVLKATSAACKRWLAELARGLGFVAGQSALADAQLALEAACFAAGDVRRVHLRIARLPDAVYLDLADADGRAVKVTRDGWEVVSRPPSPSSGRRTWPRSRCPNAGAAGPSSAGC